LSIRAPTVADQPPHRHRAESLRPSSLHPTLDRHPRSFLLRKVMRFSLRSTFFSQSM